MAKKKPTSGEQPDLIDVAPKNAKQIIKQARLYKAAQSARVSALAKEVAQKKKVLELVQEANLQRTEEGKIQFSYDGFRITVTPRDELVSVKDENEAA